MIEDHLIKFMINLELNAMLYLSSIVLQCGTKDGCAFREPLQLGEKHE